MSRWLIGFSMAAIIAFFFAVEPIPQDPAYHDFADVRTLLGIANFWNVASNSVFLLVGLAGLALVARNPRLVGTAAMQGPWFVFFTGITLTAIGSGYFHIAPSNETLVWDRLAMTVAFAGFVTIVIGEYFSPAGARRLLAPVMLAGLFSVLYWARTAAAGYGDLRPYVIVQFLPTVLVPLVLSVRRCASDLTPAMWLAVGFYMSAKLLEHFDDDIYAMTGVVSGHTLKHIAAAAAPLSLILALHSRSNVYIDD